MKIPRIIGTLIIAALLIAAISGCSGQANAHGAIESLSLGTDNITIVIDGQEIIINGDTEISGMLAEGAVIEVKFAVQDDGSLPALRIEVEDTEDIEEDVDESSYEEVSKHIDEHVDEEESEGEGEWDEGEGEGEGEGKEDDEED